MCSVHPRILALIDKALVGKTGLVSLLAGSLFLKIFE
jgi:hypothetical protein